jgi:hypothetical protein
MMASVQANPTNKSRTSYIMILHVCVVAKCYRGAPHRSLRSDASGFLRKTAVDRDSSRTKV